MWRNSLSLSAFGYAGAVLSGDTHTAPQPNDSGFSLRLPFFAFAMRVRVAPLKVLFCLLRQ
jgi:hypothetical protein